jgi:hypothetical protein
MNAELDNLPTRTNASKIKTTMDILSNEDLNKICSIIR